MNLSITLGVELMRVVFTINGAHAKHLRAILIDMNYYLAGLESDLSVLQARMTD